MQRKRIQTEDVDGWFKGSAFSACFANVRGNYWREKFAAPRQYVRDGKAINNRRRPDAIAEKAFQLRHDTY